VSLGHFWLNFNNGWSGQKYYTEASIQLFNLIFTSLPIIFLGVYDMDVSPQYVYRFPQLYIECTKGKYFTTLRFWGFILMAAVESVLFSVLPLYFLTGMKVDNGVVSTFWEAGAMCYTAIICIVNIKMFFLQYKWYIGSLIILAVSIITWFAIGFGISSFTWVDFNWYGLWYRVMRDGTFWLTLLILTSLAFVVDLAISTFMWIFFPTNLQKIIILENREKNKNMPLTKIGEGAKNGERGEGQATSYVDSPASSNEQGVVATHIIDGGVVDLEGNIQVENIYNAGDNIVNSAERPASGNLRKKKDYSPISTSVQ
jgi:hypothetical protein